MLKITKILSSIMSNVHIRWDETSTYSGIIGVLAVVASAFHAAEWKLYLTIGGSIVSLLHILFPNNLKIEAAQTAIKAEEQAQ